MTNDRNNVLLPTSVDRCSVRKGRKIMEVVLCRLNCNE